MVGVGVLTKRNVLSRWNEAQVSAAGFQCRALLKPVGVGVLTKRKTVSRPHPVFDQRLQLIALGVANHLHPVLLVGDLYYTQKLNSLHWNPVTAGFINEPWHCQYSSAVDYITNDKGLPDLVFLE